jgi:outer membrane lipoprotein SlyB
MLIERKSFFWIMAGAAALLLTAPLQAQEYRYQSAQAAPAPTTAPAQPAQNAPQPVAQPVAPAAPPCSSCGTVDSIRVTEKAGEGSAVGVIAGGVLGGLLGNQIGSGRGNTAATILGAAGGAYAGHQVEKNVKKTSQYEVNVRMEDGGLRTVTYDQEPGFRSGDKVRFIDGKLTRQ